MIDVSDDIYFFNADIDSYNENEERFSGIKVVLKNVIFEENGKLFRDHVWINKSHRFSKMKVGDTIRFRGMLYNYISSNGERIGIKNIREVSKI